VTKRLIDDQEALVWGEDGGVAVRIGAWSGFSFTHGFVGGIEKTPK
jgi:hypothetical protein